MKRAVLALLILAGPAAAREEPPLREPIFAAKASQYYPEAASQRGLSGVVLLVCRADTTGRLDDCKVGQEEPAEADFAKAALKMAQTRAITISPKAPDGRRIAEEGVHVPVRFLARWEYLMKEDLNGVVAPSAKFGAGIFPAMAPTVPPVPAEFVAEPGFAPMHEPVFGRSAHRYYPEMAQRKAVSGAVLLQCAAAADGKLEDCAAAAAHPLNWGFDLGAVAMAKAKQVRIAPGVEPGSTVRVPVRFIARRKVWPEGYNGVLSSFANLPVF